jgi:hypothetical protein
MQDILAGRGENLYEDALEFVAAVTEAMAPLKNVPATSRECATLAEFAADRLDLAEIHAIATGAGVGHPAMQAVVRHANFCFDRIAACHVVLSFAAAADLHPVSDQLLGSTVSAVMRALPATPPAFRWPDCAEIQRMACAAARVAAGSPLTGDHLLPLILSSPLMKPRGH